MYKDVVRTADLSAVSKILRSVVALSVIVGLVQGASARDSNSAQSFFSQVFSSIGGAGSEPAAPAASMAPDDQPVRSRVSRPLTVRMHRPPRIVAAQGPTKPEKVSIFEDRTLRPGDAVMTQKGIRVFVGSNSWPYRADDFVDLADAHRMDSHVHKVLADLDRMPHG